MEHPSYAARQIAAAEKHLKIGSGHPYAQAVKATDYIEGLARSAREQPLRYAAAENDPDAIRRILAQGADPNLCRRGYTSMPGERGGSKASCETQW